MSPTLYPKTGFLGRFGWGGSGFTGSLQNTHAAIRMSPRKRLGGLIMRGIFVHSLLDKATQNIATARKVSCLFNQPQFLTICKQEIKPSFFITNHDRCPP
jgi:hypothetical protein